MRATRTSVAVLAAAFLLLPAVAPPAAAAAISGTQHWWGNAPVPDGLAGTTAIDLAGAQGVALNADGTVVQWGTGGDGAAFEPVPDGLSGVTAVSASQRYDLALKSDGTVVAWGGNVQWTAQHPPVPDGLTDVTAIAAGDSVALALKADGSVVAWDYEGPVPVPPDFASGVVGIAAGGTEQVAIKADGTVVEWGKWAPPGDLANVVAVAVGDAYFDIDASGFVAGSQVIALKSDGTVVGWGGQDPRQGSVPAGLTGVTAIAAAQYHSLALKSDGTVVGWGLDDFQVVSGPSALHGVSAIVAGGQNSLAFSSLTYDFTGFFAPVDNGKLNIAKAGAAIPVKFSLGGDKGLDVLAAGYPKAGPTACDATEPTDPIEAYAAGASGLRYDATTGQYTFVWKTSTTWKGQCYGFVLKLADGTTHMADFQFK